ncbi:MAG: hypothetical protein B7Z61_03160 [Acidobacteria bacterium 37-71-11]|nr:MAG: hypothetical protein B7Z61_03160 [Acidobacteria bacterium 37-71-11]
MTSIEAVQGVVTIGVDPHPGSHTATALDALGGERGSKRVANGEDAGRELLRWGEQFARRRWAVEGAGNRFVRSVVEELLAAGEEVYSIPPSMTSEYRSRRGRKKDDVIDAMNAARALQANPGLPRYRPGEHEAHIKAVSRAYDRVSTELKRLRMMPSLVCRSRCRHFARSWRWSRRRWRRSCSSARGSDRSSPGRSSPRWVRSRGLRIAVGWPRTVARRRCAGRRERTTWSASIRAAIVASTGPPT